MWHHRPRNRLFVALSCLKRLLRGGRCRGHLGQAGAAQPGVNSILPGPARGTSPLVAAGDPWFCLSLQIFPVGAAR